MNTPTLNTRQKALALNLDAKTCGTIAEIGGGQEVAHWFFKVGGAAGTVAKTISACDMAISDGIYAMLDREFAQLTDELRPKHGDEKCFFAFADTVRRAASTAPNTGEVGSAYVCKPGPTRSRRKSRSTRTCTTRWRTSSRKPSACWASI
jgi:hypothetical protein